MDEGVLVEWNPWWNREVVFDFVERGLLDEVLKWVNRPEIVSLVGVRRSGKTTLMKLVIKHLLEEGVNRKNILFIKADDDRVEKRGLIQEAIDSYKQLINPSGKIFVFIDEVQELEDWQVVLKRFYDLNENFKFFVSGSNSSLLKEDLNNALAGRIAYFELFPFSFKEFLQQKMVVKNKVDLIEKKEKVMHFLLEYLEFGGFPEIVLEKDKMISSKLLSFYYDTIIYRDVIKRRKIRSVAKIEKMINFYLQNISSPVNFSKIGKNVGLTTDTVVEYTKFLQDAYFLFYISLFDYSIKRQEINPKKVYAIDTGLRNIKTLKFSQDRGKLVENVVFLDLKRRQNKGELRELFYWKDGQQFEVDFVIKKGLEITQLVQVTAVSKKEELEERELRGLLKASDELSCDDLVVVTWDYEAKERVKDKEVSFVPLWKWLLS